MEWEKPSYWQRELKLDYVHVLNLVKEISSIRAEAIQKALTDVLAKSHTTDDARQIRHYIKEEFLRSRDVTE